MRWKRSEYTKAPRPWTPQRLRHAAVSVQRQHDAMPLFPSLVVDPTVEARVQRMDTRESEMVARMRSSEARFWRQARAALRQLTPDQRTAFLSKWNPGPYPATGCYVLTVLKMMGFSDSGQPPSTTVNATRSEPSATVNSSQSGNCP